MDVCCIKLIKLEWTQLRRRRCRDSSILFLGLYIVLHVGLCDNMNLKRIKKENVQDSTRQKIFELEKLVFLLLLASVPWW